jgi:predicted metalloprotease
MMSKRRAQSALRGGAVGFLALVTSLVIMAGGTAQPLFAQTASPTPQTDANPSRRKSAEFLARVLGATEVTWGKIFQKSGQRYKEPKLVLFTGAVASACGLETAAIGPFYCEGDQKVYLDTRFFDDLAVMGGSAADFAQAYVIAHEIGHHVQNLLGISAKVNQLEKTLSQAERNALSVRVELQADCFAGVWAHVTDQATSILEPGDVEAALAAASALGNDIMQKRVQGTIVPESFTHGTAAQRVRWFRRGLETGEVAQCNTFDAPDL